MATDQIILDIASEIERSLEEWRVGRSTSPSDTDYVLIAYEVMGISTAGADDNIEALADTLFEDCGETYKDVEDVAVFLYDQLRGIRADGRGTPSGPYSILVDGKKVRGYRIVTNNANGQNRLSVPREIAELVGKDRRFTCELTDEGILYRYQEGGDPIKVDLPAWLTS